jgi:hypothetical protein
MADEPNHQQQQQISAMIEKKVNDLVSILRKLHIPVVLFRKQFKSAPNLT